MKILTKVTIGLTAAILFVGCNDANVQKNTNTTAVKPILDESQLGLRKTTDLLKEDVVPPAVIYKAAEAGNAKTIKRAFQDAPPMIPHSTKGMLPITKNNNQCITCHVDSAPYDKSIPSVPISHFTDFRPNTVVKGNKVYKNGHVIKNTSSEKLANVSIKKGKHLYAGRFNCSQCHAPQAVNT